MAEDHGELMPCPFCGGEAVIAHPKKADLFTYDKYYVQCKRCFATASTVTAWDHRAERTAKVEKMHRVSSVIRTGLCGSCGYDVIDSYKHCPGCGARLEWE